MATSRTASRALRAAIQQAAKPAVQRRSFIAAANTIRAAPKVAVSTGMQQQKRGKKTIDFAGVKEDVFGRSRDRVIVVAGPVLTTVNRA
jgi:ketol-acid reductoisomerase